MCWKKIKDGFVSSVEKYIYLSPYLDIRSIDSIRIFVILKILTKNNTRPDFTRSHEDFRSCTRMIVIYAISYDYINYQLSICYFWKCRTKIIEVRPEWHFCRSNIIRYEQILQVKLSYLSLIEVEFMNITEVYRVMPIWKINFRCLILYVSSL